MTKVFTVELANGGVTERGVYFIGSSFEEVLKFILNNKDIETYTEYNKWYWEVTIKIIDYDSMNTTTEQDRELKHNATGWISRDGLIFESNPCYIKEGEKVFRDNQNVTV
jgi:hypothetical protein